MTCEQAIAYIQSLTLYGWRLGNARMEALLERLGNPHRHLRVVHITGTNGKGSTTALVASILKEAGYRVGAYFSPYVFDFRERILIDGEPIAPALLVEGVQRCQPLIEQLHDTEYGQVTEFELKTALAFWAYAQRDVDFAVMEVGLGGRLDATNVIVPTVSVLVSVGLDHTDRLGPTHRDIAYEKGGIIKPGRPVVSGVLHPDAREMVEAVARRRGAPLLQVMPTVEPPPSGSPFERGNRGVVSPTQDEAQDSLLYTPLPSPTDSAVRLQKGDWMLDLHPRLIGGYQRHNVACAVGAVLCLREQGYAVPDEAIERGVARAWLPGRMQVVSESPRVVLDGAHNPDAAAALAHTLPQVFKYRRLILVFGMLHPHEPQQVLRHLLPLAEIAIFTRAPSERAYPPSELLACAQRWQRETGNRYPLHLEVCEQPQQAFQDALRRADPDDLVLITGSFYLVGAWREID
ncbi:MAG: folylpolyglutamate synthase/dihydrofolate synthase family protein [Armatimonadota bacterium]